MKRQLKSPWLSAIFNFLFPGVGYIYAGKRVGFGTGVFILTFLLIILSFTDTSLTNLPAGDFDYLYSLIFLAIFFLFAYDGYRTAEEVNR